jgi:hypothetical protein
MRLRPVVCALAICVFVAAVVVRAQGSPGTCPNDSKLLNNGPTAVYGEGAHTWWGLVIDGLNAAGFTTDEQKLEYLSGVFGVDFVSLEEARDYNLAAVEAGFDLNQNGYVCAFELRGTRAYAGDPNLNTTTFGISDDKIRKND